MKILYVAKHDKGCNDNEGAIAYALKQMGHAVICRHESKFLLQRISSRFDLLLFQNWRNPPDLKKLKCPKVFWYFDRIDYGNDQVLRSWTQYRQNWMSQIIPQIDMGFCTDGDWVAMDTSGKLLHLMQGADERFARFTPVANQEGILFTGSVYGRGEGRESFVEEMHAVYGPEFKHETRLFGNRLFDRISKTAIVVAPDGPVSDLYYSNRAYIVSSLGGFLIHPYCETLAEHYTPDEEMVFFRSREELHDKIKFYLSHSTARLNIARAGYQKTIACHLYRHRLQTILGELNSRDILGGKLAC